MAEKKNIGIYLFKEMTMMDAYGPLQFFAMVDDFNTFTFSQEGKPLMSDAGVQLMPNYGFANCPDIDVLVVPGGGNVLSQLQDQDVIDFLREKGENAEYVTSVCTGGLILAETGLLDGHQAAMHWAYKELLDTYPNVTRVDERVCISGNRITGGGVTAGMDFALRVIEKVLDEHSAHLVQLLVEYTPEPPFDSGTPETATQLAVDTVRDRVAKVADDLWEYYEL